MSYALALSGGGIRGAAHVGVLKALLNAGYRYTKKLLERLITSSPS